MAGPMRCSSHTHLFDDAIPVTTDSLTGARSVWEASCPVLKQAQLEANCSSLGQAPFPLLSPDSHDSSSHRKISTFPPARLQTGMSEALQPSCPPRTPYD